MERTESDLTLAAILASRPADLRACGSIAEDARFGDLLAFAESDPKPETATVAQQYRSFVAG
jgi:hypothetical protein